MKNPLKRSGPDYPYGRKKGITPEGEALEASGRSRFIIRIIIPVIIGIIIISVSGIVTYQSLTKLQSLTLIDDIISTRRT